MRPRAPNFTYSSKVLRFALCDPQGLPVFVGSTVRRCLGQYVMMRGSIVLGDESERQYWDVMHQHKWSIRNAEITCKTSTTIEELPPHEKDKAKGRAAEGRQVQEGRQTEPIAREPQSRKEKIAAARGEKTKSTRPQASRRKTRTA